MKSYTMPAVLLGLLVTVGCADRGDNAQNLDDKKAAAPAEPPADREAAPTRRDSVPARESDAGARGTAGSRSRTAASATRPAAAAPSDAAPRGSAAAESSPAARRVEWREVTIPAGTALPLELETALSSETAQVETPVRAKLKQAVVVDGVTALPAGAMVSGNVTSAQRAGKVKGRASLAFSFNQIRADNMSAGIRDRKSVV